MENKEKLTNIGLILDKDVVVLKEEYISKFINYLFMSVIQCVNLDNDIFFRKMLCELKHILNKAYVNGFDINLDIIKKVIDEIIISNNKIEIDYLISLLNNESFIFSKDHDMKLKVIEYGINIKDDNVELYRAYADLLLKLVLKCKNREIQSYILKKIDSVNSLESLKLLFNVYPVLDKYSNTKSIKMVIDSIINKDYAKSKKLVIPIDYQE